MLGTTTWPAAPVFLSPEMLEEPKPVSGCDECASLARRRDAETDDPSRRTDLNILMRRHLRKHWHR